MPKTIVLVNADTIAHVPRAVSGASGVTYGHAHYLKEYNAHAFKMPESEWSKNDYRAAKDITRGMRRAGCSWVVRVEGDNEAELQVRIRQLETALRNVTAQLEKQGGRITDEPMPTIPAQAEPEPLTTLISTGAEGTATAQDLTKLKYFSLVKLAGTIGVENPKQYKGSAALIAAINAKQLIPA